MFRAGNDFLDEASYPNRENVNSGTNCQILSETYEENGTQNASREQKVRIKAIRMTSRMNNQGGSKREEGGSR